MLFFLYDSKASISTFGGLNIRFLPFIRFQKFASWVILEPKINAISPPKAILIGVFSSACGRIQVYHIVFFHHLARFLKNLVIVGYPPLFQFFRRFIKPIVAKANI